MTSTVNRQDQTEQTTSPGLSWQLVEAAPGALLYSAPPVQTAAAARRRQQSWTPEGDADQATGANLVEPEQHSVWEYAGHVGRVGLLAAALGIGAALARTPGVAWAEPADTESAPSESQSQSAESDTTTSTTGQADTTAQQDTTTSTPDTAGPSSTSDSSAAAQTSTSPGSETSVSVSAPGSEGPEVVVSSSGGAHTSTATTDTGSTDTTPAEPVIEQPAEQPAVTRPASSESARDRDSAHQAASASERAATPAAAPVRPVRPASPATVTRPPAAWTRVLAPTAPAVAAAPAPIQPVSAAAHVAVPATLPAAPVNVVTSLLGTLGFSPWGATTGASGAVMESPVSWAVLDLARRRQHPTGEQSPAAGPVPTGPVQGGLAQNAVSFQVSGGPAEGTVTITPDATFTYTPTAEQTTTPTDLGGGFTVTVSDPTGHTTTVPVTLTTDTTTATPETRLTLTAPNTTTDAVHVVITPTGTDQADHLVVHNPTYTTTGSATAGQITTTVTQLIDAGTPAAAAPTTTAAETAAVAAATTSPWVSSITVGKNPLGVATNPVLPRIYVANQYDKTMSVIDSATGKVVATVAVGGPATGIAVSPDGTRAYVTLKAYTGKVAVVDTATNTVITTVKVGANPTGIAVSPTGDRVYVANNGAGTVSVIDTTANTVIATVKVGMAPAAVAVNNISGRIYVANTNSDSVSVIDGAINAVIATVKVGDQPRDLAVSAGGGAVMVTSYGGNSLWRLNTATNTASLLTSVGYHPVGVAISPDQSTIAVANSNETVTLIDTDTEIQQTVAIDAKPLAGNHYVTITPDGRVWVSDMGSKAVRVITTDAATTIGVGTIPIAAAVSPDGTRAYVVNLGDPNDPSSVGTVSVINTATNTVIATITVGHTPAGVALNPAGTRAYVTNEGSTTVSVIDTTSNTVITNIQVGLSPGGVAVSPDGTKAYVTNENAGTVSVINTATNQVINTIAVGPNPTGVAVNPLGTRVYVTSVGTGTTAGKVAVIDPATNKVVATISVGKLPYLVAVSPDGTRAYVANQGANSVSVINTATNRVVTTIKVGIQPFGLAVSPDGKTVYVANPGGGTVSLIDTTTNTMSANNPVGTVPFAVAVSPDGTHLYVTIGGTSSVSVIAPWVKNVAPIASLGAFSAPDPSTGRVTALLTASDPEDNPITVTSSVPSQGLLDIVDNIDGTWTLTYTPTAAARLNAALNPAAVTDTFTVTVTDIHGDTTPVAAAAPIARGYFAAIETLPLGAPTANNIGLAVSGNTGYITNAADRFVVAVDLTTNLPIWGPVTLGSSPVSMAISGNNLYVADYTDNEVVVLNKDTGIPGDIIPVGRNPQGMTVAGNYLYVANRADNTVSVIDTTTNTLVDTSTAVAGIQPITVGKQPVGVAASSTGGLVYVSNYADHTVSVINTTTNKVATTITSYAGKFRNPTGMAVNGNRLYVANTGTDTVSVIDITTNKLVGVPIAVGDGPTGVMVNPDGSLLYVTNSPEGTVTVIDTATNTVIDTNPSLSGVQPLTVGSNPIQMAANGSRIYIANSGDTTVSILDIAANGSPAVGHPAYTLSAPDPADGSIHVQLFLADPDGDPVTVVEIVQGVKNGGIDQNPVETGEVNYTPAMAARIRAGLPGGETTEHWVFKVSDGVNAPVTVTIDVPISATDMTVAAARPGPTNAMVVGADGTKAYVAGDNAINPNTEPGTIFVVDPSGNVTATITVGVRPSGVVLHGNQLWVTNAGPDSNGDGESDPGDDTVTVIDTTNNNVLGTITVGNDPRGVAISEFSGHAYVSNWGSNSVTVIDTSDFSLVGTITTGIGNHPWGVAASYNQPWGVPSSDDDGRYVYVANSWSNSVSVIDTATDTVTKTLTGYNPGDLNGPIGLVTVNYSAMNEDGVILDHWLFVANVNGGVTVFDTDNNVQVDQGGPTISLPGGARPFFLAASSDGSIVYASVPGTAGAFDNKVYAIDTRYRIVLDTDFHVSGVQPLTVGTAPMAMAFNAITNQLYVLNRVDGTISTVSMTRL